MKNTLITHLETLPGFSGLKKALKEKLQLGNFYVDYFTSHLNNFEDYKDEEGRQRILPLNDYEIEDNAIEDLINDQTGYFDDFVTGELANDAIELVRSIIKEIRKC